MTRVSAVVRPLVSKRPEPSYPTLPRVGRDGESSVRGVFLLGEVAGTPLIKLGLNAGVDLVNELAPGLKEPSQPDVFEMVVVGAGASGLAAALRAHGLGLRVVVLESERIASTVIRMYKGKHLFAEPVNVANKSELWFEECTREALLDRWRAQIAASGLDVREHERVTDVRGAGAHLEVHTTKGRYKARRVILAVGKAGNPRKAGVPGELEHAHKLHHDLSDPSAVRAKRVVVYGAGDVACEAALALADQNNVTMVAVDTELVYPKKRNADAVRAAAAAGNLDLHLGSRLLGFDAATASFRDASGAERKVENDLVYEMIGAELPLPFFKKIGVRLEGEWAARRFVALALVFIAVYSLYALKKFPEQPYSWPFSLFIDKQTFFAGLQHAFDVAFAPFGWLFSDQAIAQMRETPWFQQGYLYSLAYTIVMFIFGRQALLRWTTKARDPRYQRWRYVTLIGFQVVFFLAANVVAVQALSIQHAWRAWGLYQPWPLFFHTFHWWDASDPRVVLALFIGVGLLGTFVIIPLLARNHGKRFCTWVCGCGGLAETLGDRWRHLAPKGARSRAWEFQGAVILVVVAIVTLVTIGGFSTRADNAWAAAYSYVVDFWLVAVIPIAAYPFFGGKIWCRYWCPLAAWNQILARWYGRLQIKSNERCITCGECSKYCQVGVDVMAFAKNQQPFDNKSSSCIQCGICIDVCPIDVLSFSLRQTTPRAPKKSLPVLQ